MVGSLLQSRFYCRHATLLLGGAWRDDTKNGCAADYRVGGTNLPQWPPQKQLNSIVTV